MGNNAERVGVYIDGYNFYYGLERKRWRRYLWLDYRGLFESMIRSDQELVEVHYFTCLTKAEGSRQRQQTYLNALRIRGGLTITEGRVEVRRIRCKECGKISHKRNQEKETDVAIATAMLLDAVDDRVDTMWLVTNDSDLVPVVKALTVRFGIKVVIVKPPSSGKSAGDHLVHASGNPPFYTQRRKLAQNQLPDSLQAAPRERRQRRPIEWYPLPTVDPETGTIDPPHPPPPR